MAKMRANPALEHKPGAFSCMGEHYTPDREGWIDIPKVMVETARAHGFVTAEDFGVHVANTHKASGDLTKNMSRRQLIAYCTANDLKLPDEPGIEALRSFVTSHIDEG